MKNLKLGIFSLLAILAVSVFLTSCEQEAIIPGNPLDSQESNQDMSNIDLKAYHNYLNSISKEDFEVSEVIYTQVDELNLRNNQIQMTNITSLMKLDDDADKAALLNILLNPNMVVGSGHISSPKFSTFEGSDIIERMKEVASPGKYVVITDSKINDTSVKSIAIIGKEGIIWDNIYSLIDVREQTATEIELNTKELAAENLEKGLGNGGCRDRSWKLDIGKNIYGGVVATAFLKLKLCWDRNGNFSEDDSLILDRYCDKLLFADCVAVGGVISGWGTNKVKIGLGGDYAAPGTSLGISSGPWTVGFSPGSVSGLDRYGETFAYSGW